MIGLEKELLTRTGLIINRKATKEVCLVRRPMVSRRFDKKPEEKGAKPKEQRVGTGSGIW